MDIAHTFTPSPDGRYAVTETEYQYTPLRIWDLGPGQAGDQNIDIPISAWTPTGATSRTTTKSAGPTSSSRPTRTASRSSSQGPEAPEDRWRVVHVRGEHGTASAERRQRLAEHDQRRAGRLGVDVRNADGLIVISDMRTGLWLFKMDGFNGWNGHHCGMPNISSVQD